MIVRICLVITATIFTSCSAVPGIRYKGSKVCISLCGSILGTNTLTFKECLVFSFVTFCTINFFISEQVAIEDKLVIT